MTSVERLQDIKRGTRTLIAFAETVRTRAREGKRVSVAAVNVLTEVLESLRHNCELHDAALDNQPRE
jgi:hypothetical protein